jgi:hypothetical protein
MISLFKVFLIIFAFGFWVTSIVISHFQSDRKLWIAIPLGIFGGFCAGIYLDGFPSGLITGSVFGFFVDLVLVPSSLITKYYRNKGKEWFQKY